MAITQIVAGQTNLRVVLTIGGLLKPASVTLPVKITVQPATPVFADEVIDTNWTLDVSTIPLPVTDALIRNIQRFIENKIPSYFDQNRVGKTLLNLGGDYQIPLTNWKYDESDTSRSSIAVKLYRPLGQRIQKNASAWISRELSPSLVDTIHAVFVPGGGKALYLRPPNRAVKTAGLDGTQVNNVTFQTLFTTNSLDVANPSDPIMDSWFVTSLEGAELNIDYSDFSKFVFYGSAQQKLNAFKNKLVLIEDFNHVISDQSASLASMATASQDFTASLAYSSLQNIVTQRNDIIRSFDGYERFLYYSSGSEYSSSFSGDGGVVDQLYWFDDATWPKVSGSIMSVASASSADLYGITSAQFNPSDGMGAVNSWYDVINNIARQYDEQNRMRLVNSLPDYLTNDQKSTDFLTFMDMVGHHFDALKVYADAMPHIYDRSSNPAEGMSPDLVWNIAESFGINLPNQYAVKSLVDYTIGELGTVDPYVYRQVAAETWKRFLHNHMYLLKTKGTKNSLTGLLNVYGVLPTTVQIRETATPSFYMTQSYETIEEQTNTLYFTSSSYVQVPFSGSSRTIQTRFSTTTVATQSVFNVGTSWSLRTIPLSASYGHMGVYSGSTLIASSSVFEIFNGDYYNVTTELASDNSIHLWTLRSNEFGDIVDNSHVSASVASSGIWYSGSTVFLGGNMQGNIDEFRLWSEILSSQTIGMHAQYPALYNGNTSTSALNNLLVRLSFGSPINLGVAPFRLTNESPYIRQYPTVTSLLHLSASNFANTATYPYSMEIVTRNVLRYAPNVGGSQFVNNKIIIEDAPVLRYFADDSGSNIPILAHDRSIVLLDEKFDDVRSVNTVGFYFSLTDAINDSIIRSVGNIDIQDYIGDPSSLYENKYTDLSALNKLYWTYYAYTYNYNSFVEFVDTLLQPLFIQARELVPARAKLLTGIVLESPILERNKIQYKKIDVSGYNTFNAVDTPTLYAEPTTTQPTTIVADAPIFDAVVLSQIDSSVASEFNDLTAPLDTGTVVDPLAFMDMYEGLVNTVDSSPIFADSPTFDSTLRPITSNTLESAVASIDDEQDLFNYTNFLLTRFGASDITNVPPGYVGAFNQLLTTYKPGSHVKVATGMNTDLASNLLITIIEPNVNYDDISSTQYFIQSQGLYQLVVQNRVRAKESTLSNAGTWTKGATYVANQYVTQSGQTGAASSGNGYEYVCVTSAGSGSFISYNPPSLDTENWRKMTYINVNVGIIKMATQFSDGTVHLVTSGSSYTAFTGYTDFHYRFFEDYHLATLRHKRLGCKQSDDTTFDGGPAVEIIRSSGDTLVVSTGAEPIQRTNDTAGPILTVR